MESGAQTWHYGLIAKWWSEFNDDFRAHEIPYFQRQIEHGGEPALDVGCGTGRLLIPYLRAGLDVDGCDTSPDMVALCREKAAREGLSPTLFVQAMHELDPPRRYRTIVVCGAFGLGSTREHDLESLRRFHEHLEPGGSLLVDIEVPYADGKLWRHWLKDERAKLPEAAGRPALATTSLRRQRAGAQHANRRARPAHPAGDLRGRCDVATARKQRYHARRDPRNATSWLYTSLNKRELGHAIDSGQASGSRAHRRLYYAC